MSEKMRLGSVGLSEESLEFVRGYVNDKEYSENMNFKPFDTIISAFTFFFSLGYEMGYRRTEASKGNVAPRGYNIESFLELISEEVRTENKSMGAIISSYAEGGIAYTKERLNSGKNLQSVFSEFLGE